MPWSPALARLGVHGARRKHVFGGRGFMLGRHAAVIVWDERRIVKVPAAEYAAALAEPGATPFAPDGARPMSPWAVVATDAIADGPELAAWVARGVAAAR